MYQVYKLYKRHELLCVCVLSVHQVYFQDPLTN